MTRVLVACVGNIFLGDDGFGTEVARTLRGHGLSEEVRVEDEPSMYYGGVGAALTRVTGALEAVADPRREGVARVVDGGGAPQS